MPLIRDTQPVPRRGRPSLGRFSPSPVASPITKIVKRKPPVPQLGTGADVQRLFSGVGVFEERFDNQSDIFIYKVTLLATVEA